MKTYLVSFLLAFIVSMILTPIAAKLAQRLNLLDFAWQRKVHSGAIPRVGGVAVAISFYLPVVGLLFWDNRLSALWTADWTYIAAMVIGGAATVFLGLVDDFHNLRARYKLLAQFLIAVFVCVMGIQIKLINLPFIGDLDMGIFAVPITIFWIMGFMNALNLIDGIDGLCAGLVFIALVTVFILSVTDEKVLVAFFAAALGGAVLGFLRYNFNPAKVFLGDAGSYFLGFILALVSIKGAQKANVSIAILAPLLAVSLPIADTLWSIIRRSITGRPLFVADRGHIHHLLLDNGLSVKRTVLLLYLVSALLAFAGLVIVIGRQWEIGLALIGSFIIIAIVVRFLVRTILGMEKIHIRGEKASGLLDTLPGFISRMNKARTSDDLKAELFLLAEFIEAEEVEFVVFNGEKKIFQWKWQNPPKEGISEKIRLTELIHELPMTTHAKARFRWTWRSEMTKVDPDTDALLNLAERIVIRQWRDIHASELAHQRATGTFSGNE